MLLVYVSNIVVVSQPALAQEPVTDSARATAFSEHASPLETGAAKSVDFIAWSESHRLRELEERSMWKHDWRHWSPGDSWYTAGMVALVIGAQIIGPQGNFLDEPPDFDREIRSVLAADNPLGLQIARDVSDVGLAVSVATPLFFDSFINAWWVSGDKKAAIQMALLTGQVHATVRALQSISNISGRRRPLTPRCGDDIPDDNVDCESDIASRSLFSGHASVSFGAAAATCMYHVKMPELNHGVSPFVPCGVSYGLAATTAIMRLVGDKHYASDVMVGAAVGTLVGTLLPLWKMSSFLNPDIHTDELSISLVPFHAGLAIVGSM